MPLQYPNPYNPYQEQKTVNVPAILLTIVVVIALAGLVLLGLKLRETDKGDSDDFPPFAHLQNFLSKFKADENPGIAVGEPNPNGYDCSRDVYNCDNFTTRSEAQVAFDSCDGDPWRLDNDNDGTVCEGLK